MANIEIPGNFECEARTETITLTTATNGDRIMVKNLDLNEKQAATLAYLINLHVALKIEIREIT